MLEHNGYLNYKASLKKDNFTSKYAKAKENIKLCITRIEKKCKHKNI
jgi:hypothetical protein